MNFKELCLRAILRTALWVAAVCFCLPRAFLASANQDFLAEYVQTHFTETGGLSVTSSNRVLQTKDGYIWAASYNGLIRYDGRRSKVFGKKNGSFPTDNIYTIFVDSRGDLWVGTNDAGIALYQGGSFTFLGPAEGLPSKTVRAMAEDNAGNVYVSTISGLVCITPGREIVQVDVPGAESVFATNISVSRSGQIWCALSDGGVLVLDRREVKRVFPSGYFNGAAVDSIYCSTKGPIYLGSFDDSVMVCGQDAPEDYKVLSAAGRNNINGFYEDRHGRLWICAGNGVGYFQGDVFYPVDGLLVNNAFQNIIEDYEGNYWLSSSRHGILLLTRAKFKDLFFARSLPPQTVNAVTLYDGKFHIGTDDGLLVLDPNGETVENDLTEKLEGARIRCLLPDTDGGLWICTYQAFGAARWNGSSNELLSIRAQDGLVNERVRSAHLARGGGVIVATGNGISLISGDEVVRSYAKNDGLTVPTILNVIQGPGDVIYAGSDGGGIYKIEGGKVTNFSEEDGLTSGVILRMTADEKNQGVWISASNGVCFMDRSENIRSIDKLSQYSNSIFDILLVGEDDLWLLGAEGIFVCSRSNLLSDEPLTIKTFGRMDGLSSPITANSWNCLSEDGTLYIACARGVNVIDTKNIYMNAAVPKIAISGVTIDGREHENPGSAITVPSEANRVTVNFALLSYASSSMNTMTVMLEGFDKEPSEYDMNLHTSISYTNIGGGDYLLRLTGTNKDGVKSRELTLKITKVPSFTERPAAQWLMAALAFGFIFTVAKLYGRYKMRAQNRLLRAVNMAASLLIADIHEDQADAIQKVLEILGESVDADFAALWRGKGERFGEWRRQKKKTSAPGTQYKCIPITIQGYSWGTIGFAWKSSPRELSEQQKNILASGGMLIANAVMRSAMVEDYIEAKDAALASTKAKSDFLARMSHEIRTPMNAAIGLSELAIHKYGSPKGLEYLVGIRQASSNLLAIINDILDFSKIESGNLPIHHERYGTASMLNDVLTIIRVKLEESPIEFVSRVDSRMPAAMVGDETRVRQVLLNLLSNAVKYTKEGFIEFSAQCERSGASALLTFRVADSGIGIRAEDLPKLFGEFIRVDDQRNRAVEGTGLGLSIARSLCRAMGGDIKAESEYGAGSVFTAAFVQEIADDTPMGSLDAKTFIRSGVPNVPFTAPGFRALVVDDVLTNLMVMEGFLSPYKADVVLCESGGKAVELAREGRFDIIFMDHMMPGMDGIEAAKAIRALGGNWVPIIALTANAIVGMREMFLENGFDDFLAKPIETRKLNELMGKWVPQERRKPLDLGRDSPETPRAMEIEGLDTKRGTALTGGTEAGYRTVLRQYCRDASARMEFLDLSYAERDPKNFITQVHALKSASASIGALDLSEAAASLEKAGKAGDAEYIRTHLDDFRQKLFETVTRVRAALATQPEAGKENSKENPAGEKTLERLSSLKEALTSDAVGRVHSLLKELEELEELTDGADAAKEFLSAVSDLVLMSEFDEAVRVIDAFLKKHGEGK
ncbi:MAG: response regulator [Synergistaceae bacterium]|nr:response regulator [Synergistaceae bacterium]